MSKIRNTFLLPGANKLFSVHGAYNPHDLDNIYPLCRFCSPGTVRAARPAPFRYLVLTFCFKQIPKILPLIVNLQVDENLRLSCRGTRHLFQPIRVNYRGSVSSEQLFEPEDFN